MKQLKSMKIKDLLDAYLKTETTTTGDISLPPDKASTDTKAGRKSKKKKKDEEDKKKLLIGKKKKIGDSG
jgi:hypothetical protein